MPWRALRGWRSWIRRIPSSTATWAPRWTAWDDTPRPWPATTGPYGPTRKTGEAHRCKGDALCSLGRPSEALACYEAAIRANSQDGGAHAGRATALDRLGRHQEADLAWGDAMVLDPSAVTRVADRTVSDAKRLS